MHSKSKARQMRRKDWSKIVPVSGLILCTRACTCAAAATAGDLFSELNHQGVARVSHNPLILNWLPGPDSNQRQSG